MEADYQKQLLKHFLEFVAKDYMNIHLQNIRCFGLKAKRQKA